MISVVSLAFEMYVIACCLFAPADQKSFEIELREGHSPSGITLGYVERTDTGFSLYSSQDRKKEGAIRKNGERYVLVAEHGGEKKEYLVDNSQAKIVPLAEEGRYVRRLDGHPVIFERKKGECMVSEENGDKFFFVRPAKTVRCVDRLLADYEKVDRLTCDIRRTVESRAGEEKQSLQFLSHVYWQRGGKLHVKNETPLERIIVSDGTNFYSYVSGDPKGFSRPVADLDREMSVNLQRVPGTGMDHLLMIGGAPETTLPPEDGFAARFGYATPNLFAVLCLDESRRLARVELYKNPDQKQRLARYDYSQFREVRPGAWIPQLTRGVVSQGPVESVETIRLDRLDADASMAPNLFNPTLYFKNVTFEDAFSKIYDISPSP